MIPPTSVANEGCGKAIRKARVNSIATLFMGDLLYCLNLKRLKGHPKMHEYQTNQTSTERKDCLSWMSDSRDVNWLHNMKKI
jgi:hypothetical protein